jgi:tight adherence protein B
VTRRASTESKALLPAQRPTSSVTASEASSHGRLQALRTSSQPSLPSTPDYTSGDLVPSRSGRSTPLAPSIPVLPVLAVGAMIGILGSLAAHSVMLAVLVPAVVLLIRSRLLRSRLRAAENEQRAAVVDFCSSLRAELQAGRQPSAAIADAVWCRPELRDLAEACSRPAAAHEDPADLLSIAAHTPGREGLGALAACWRATERHGVPLTEAVCGIEDGLRAEQQRRQSLAAELAGVRATVTMLSVLPGFGLALGSALGTDPLRTMLTRPVGETCLVIGFLLEVAGLHWSDRLVNSALHAPRRTPSRIRIRTRRSWLARRAS